MPTQQDDPLEILRKNKQRQARLLALASSDDDEGYDKALQESATGRDYRRESYRARQLKTTEEGLADPNITPSARRSLTILKDYITSPDFGKLPANHGEDIKVVNEDGMVVSGGSDRARSLVTGFADAIPQLVDLPLAIAQKLGVHTVVDKMRAGLTEGRAMVRESIDARTPGLEGTALEFLGALSNPAALKGYNKITEASGKVMSGAAKAVGLEKLGQGITSGLTSANPFARAATNVATGLPLNIAQQAQLPDGASGSDQAKQLLFGVTADALGGAAFGGRRASDPVRVIDPNIPKPDLEAGGVVEVTPDKQAILDAMALKAKQAAARKAIDEEAKAYDSASRTQAAAEWQAANMGEKWRDVPKDDRIKIVTDWQKEHTIDWWREKVGKPAPVVENLAEGGVLPTTAPVDPPPAPVAAQEGVAIVPQEPEVVVPVKSELELMQEKFAATKAATAIARGEVQAPSVESLRTPEMRAQEVALGDVSAIPDIMEVVDARVAIYKIFDTPYAKKTPEMLASAKENLAMLEMSHKVAQDYPELVSGNFIAEARDSLSEAKKWVDVIEEAVNMRVTAAAKTAETNAYYETRRVQLADELAAASRPKVEAPVPTKLPKELEKASPNYSYGEKRFTLKFDSDVDKAAYITAQATKSKRDKDFLEFAMNATGMDEAAVRAYGAQVKARIKNMAKDGTAGVMQVDAGTPGVVGQEQGFRGLKVVSSMDKATAEIPKVAEPIPDVPPVVQNSTPAAPTFKELDKLEDNLMKKISKLEKRWQSENPGKSLRYMIDWKDPEYIATRNQLNEVSTQKDLLPDEDDLDDVVEIVNPKAPTGGTVRVAPKVDPTAPTRSVEQKVITPASKDLREAQIDMRKAMSPRKLTDEELVSYVSGIQERIGTLGDPDAEKQYMKLLEGVIGEQTARKVTNQMKSQANMPPGVLGAGVGFTYGVATTDEKDPEAATRIMMWTLAGAAAGYGAGKLGEKIQIRQETRSKINNLFPGQSAMAKDQADVIGIGDKVKAKQPFTAMMRNWYNGGVRRIASFENMVGKLPVQNNLPLAQNPVKLAEHFNRSIARTESWNHLAVVIDGPDGEPIYIGPTFFGEEVKPAQHILAMVNQDKEGLGKVMVALTSLELHSMGHERVPYAEDFATLIVKNAPQNYIDAAREFRKFNLAMLKVMQFSGRLSQETFDVISKEEWYAPLYRSVEGGTTRNIRDLKKDRINTGDPFKARQGGSKKLDVINPVDQTLTLLPYVLRHHEYSQWVDGTVKLLRMQPPEVQRQHIKLVKSSDSETVKKIMEEAKTLRESVPMTNAESDRLMAFKDDGTSATGGGGYITHWEQGVLSTYKVSDVVFDTAKSLLPFERDVVNNLLFRAARGTTRLATKGVVMNPKFVVGQFIVDTFDAALTSKYGFRPGIDSFRGWWSQVARTPEYLRVMDMGGPGSIQSLPYQNAESATKMFAAEGKSALAVSWNHMKEMHPIEAYKALAMPLADASRMGEALRAFDHKASTIEAVFAAREVGFNVSMEGSFTSIRALHQLSMFTRPGFQAIDALARAAMRDPAKFLAKGTAYIALPTVGLWYANKDDKEIQKWRKTQVGKAYWFVRGPSGDVMRIRKPHVIGQLFGTAMEEALDKAYGQDPQVAETLSQVYRDAAANMLPLFGVIPLSLLADKDFSDLGEMRPITTESDQGLDPKYQGRDRASLPARIISDVSRNILSPAQTDYIIRTVSTTVGMDFAQGITAAHEYQAYGFVPAKYELPIVRGFFQNPRSQGQEVYQFYKYMEDIEPAALTSKHLSEPGNLVKNSQAYINYYKENAAKINLIDTFTEARKDIGEYRRALEDMDKMKAIVSQSTIESVKKQYLMLIEERARSANLVAKAMGME